MNEASRSMTRIVLQEYSPEFEGARAMERVPMLVMGADAWNTGPMVWNVR